jgi:hypothetical protein
MTVMTAMPAMHTTISHTVRLTKALLFGAAIIAGGQAPAVAVGPRDKPPVPDLTAGGKPLDDKTITLGPTGLRGWVWGWKGHTTLARQILVTAVADGSPAADSFIPGDVIVGLAGERFTSDARLALARAITAAEGSDGTLPLTRWRQGKTDEVTIELPVLGRYGATAPSGCSKSEKILAGGCRAIAERGFRDGRGRIDVSIPNDLNALALLASGDDQYLPLVKEYAEAVARHRPGGHISWGYAYETLFLAEYVLATGDESVRPGLERLALDIARGQSGVGTWGHAFARPAGNLNGYGCMNQPGIVLTLAMVIAREAGIASPDLDRAIARSERFLQWYIGKGAIPYGDHAPWPDHDDNGKCSSAAVLFDLLGRRDGADFFSRMATAAHAERESGHTGNFFNVLWALPGVSRAGRDATGAYLAETAWYYDLARDHEGRFTHQGIPGEPDKDQYRGWDTTGAMLLAYALPATRLALTGRTPSVAARLTGDDLAETIAAGPWNFWDGQETIYDPRSTAALMAGIASWSPAVRLRSARALGKKSAVPLETIIARLDDDRPETRYGACTALRFLGPRADAAAEKLRGLLRSADPWDRVMAAEALVEMSDRVRNESLVPLLQVIVRRSDDPADPRRCSLGPLVEVLFKPGPGKREPRSILAGSLDLVDPPHRPLLVEAIRTVMHSQDGRIRSGAASLYGRLSPSELASLLPDILEAIRTPAPSGEMFAYDIRMRGLELLAKLRIAEGMELAVAVMNEKRWGRDFARAARALATYGGAAKHLLPTLEGPTRKLVADEGKGRPESLEQAIDAIKADREPEPVVTAAEFIARHTPAAAATAVPSAAATHETRDVLGWTLHIDKALLAADAAATETAVSLLEKQLAEVVRVVPAAAVAELKKTPLWFSPEYPGVGPKAEFHPDPGWLRNNGRDPALARAIEFTNIRIFPQECERMPNFALHELAHAYHFNVLGFDDPAVREAYDRARAAGLYDKVEQRHGNGRPATVGRAYAMSDEKEYFAETSEAYFSRNDFFPFTRDELEAHDPRMLRVLEAAWGVAATKEPRSTR